MKQTFKLTRLWVASLLLLVGVSQPSWAAYYLAGSFPGNSWTVNSNDWKFDGNGYLTKTLEKSSNYEFKVTDGSWTNTWGSYNFNRSSNSGTLKTNNSNTNCNFVPDVSGEYTFHFDGSKLTITYPHEWGVKSSADGWSLHPFALGTNDYIYTNLSADQTYEIGVEKRSNGYFYTLNKDYGPYTKAKSGTKQTLYTGQSSNYQFTTAGAGDYKITISWSGSDPQITITYPEYTGLSAVAMPNAASSAPSISATSVIMTDGVTVTAKTGNTGYQFKNWTSSNGNFASTTDATTTFTPTANSAVATANYQVKVTYNANGHGTAPTAIWADYNSTITAPTAPEETGYTFGGWYKESGCTNQWIFASNKVTTPITLYAQWTANTDTPYKVEHYQQNIANDQYTLFETEDLTGTTGESVTPAVKSYTGFTAPNTQTKTIAADGSLVVKYNYTRNSHTLTWNADGGEITGTYTSGTVKYGATITAPADANVTKTGFNFVGWMVNNVVTTPATTMPDNDLTYTAKWESAAIYSLTVNAATGGSIITPDGGSYSDITHGTAYNIVATANTGYNFNGWTKRDGDDVTFGDASLLSTTATVNAGSAIVTANFAAKTTTLTLLGNGGTPESQVITATYDQPCPSFTEPTRTGYTYGGYISTKDGTTNVINKNGTFPNSGTYGKSGNLWGYTTKDALDIYAKWTAKYWTRELNKNYTQAGANHGSYKATYGATSIEIKSEPTPRTGYTLVGYATAAQDGIKVAEINGNLIANVAGWTNDKGEWINTEGENSDTNPKLYAIWEENMTTVTLAASPEGAGSFTSGGEPVTEVLAGTSNTKQVSVTAVPNFGYEFTSWAISAGSVNPNNSATTKITGSGVAQSTATATATFTPLNIVYFQNTLNWEEVYVYIFTNQVWEDNKGVKANDDNNGKKTPKYTVCGKMTCLNAENGIYGFGYTNAQAGQYIAFSDKDFSNYEYFYQKDACYRGDFNTACGVMFVPSTSPDPTDKVNQTQYYNSGYWSDYNTNTTNLYLKGINGSWEATEGNRFVKTTPFATTASLTVNLIENKEFKLFKDCGDGTWYSYSPAITKDNCTDLEFKDNVSENASIQITEKDEYTFTIDLLTKKLSVTYPAAQTYTVTMAVDGPGTTTPTTSVELNAFTGTEITATPTEHSGYHFKNWTGTDGITFADANAATTTATATGTGTITAHFEKDTYIYFNNTIAQKWKDSPLYIYLYKGDGYWDDKTGTGAAPNGNYMGRFAMTKLPNTEIWSWHYDQLHNFQGDNKITHVAFSDKDMDGYQNFYDGEATYKSYNDCMNMFVPDASQTPEQLNNTDYYNAGFWRKYNDTSSKMYLHIWDVDGNKELKGEGYEMITKTAGNDAFNATVKLENSHKYNIYIGSCDGKNFSRETAIASDKCSGIQLFNYGSIDDKSKLAYLQTAAGGNYVFTLTYDKDKMTLSVEYPVTANDYRVKTGTPTRYSNIIRSTEASGTISMFLNAGINTLTYEEATNVDVDPIVWGNTKSINVNVTNAGVYTMTLTKGASPTITNVQPYTGKYYVRTDCAQGGWNEYKTNDNNLMRYTDRLSYPEISRHNKSLL